MTERDITRALQRYRTGYLKLRSVLHDRTTALPAYPLLMDGLRNLLGQRRWLGVLHLSVANLDTVESLYGWQVFDRVLSRVATVLRAAVNEELPAQTLLCVDRVAGDQFVVFVPQNFDGRDVDGQFLAETGAAVCTRLERVFDVDDFAGLNPRLSFRAGHALLSINPFYRFERRVYAAVEEARAREGRREERRERSWAEELRRIIEESAVRMVFQPVVDLQTRSVLGYEAFARGPKDSVFEMPRAMFSMSSRVGVAVALDRLCRNAALRESAGVSGQGKLFLNVLPVSLKDPEWQEGGNAALKARQMDRWALVLEVSERGADQDSERFIGALEDLKALGFSLALDDIGTGYASLSTLERVRPDYLKVDETLVRNIHENLIKQEVFASLVQIADRIGALVIAEGIESEEEAAALRSVGAHYGQGFLFAVPSPAESLGLRERSDGTDH